MRRIFTRIAMASAFVGLVAFTAQESAAAGRGGGARGGGATSVSRGGGGGGTGFSRGGSYSRPSGGASASQRPASSGNRSNVNTGNINTGNVNRGNVNTGNINTGNINTGNVNVNTGNVNIHVDNDYNGWGGGWHDYPIAAGVRIGRVAAVTAVAIGSAYYALPPACSPYPWQTYTYYYCGSVYYRPQYEGDTVVYVAVPKPK